MADTDVQVSFGAKTDDIDRGSAAVATRINDIKGQTDAMASQFTAFGDTMKAAFGEAENTVLHFDETLKSLNKTIEAGGNVSPTSGILALVGKAGPIGIAIAAVAALVEGVHLLGEEMIKLEQRANETGVSIQRFQLLQSAFNAAGVSTDKIASGLDEVSKKLTNIKYDSGDLGKFLDANNVKWKDSKDNVISTNDYLKESARLLQVAVAEGGAPLARKVGESLGLSQELVRVLQQGPVAFDLLVKKAAELGVGLDAEVVHKAAQFEKEWNAATSNMATWFKAQLAGLLPAMQEWGMAVANAIRSAFSTIFAELKGVFQEVTARWAGDVDTFAGRFGAAEGSIKALATGTAQLSASLSSSAKSADSLGGEFEGLVATGKKFEAIKFPDNKDGKFDPTALREFAAQLDAVREKYQLLKITEQTAVDTYKQTEGQKVATLREALAAREKATDEIFAEEIAKYGDNARVRANIERNYQKEIFEIQREGLRLQEEQLKRSTQQWESMLRGISTAFTGQLRGILQGTTTWAQAVKNIMLELVLKIIDEFLLLAVIKPLSGMLASALAAPSEILGALIKVITSMFGPLFAGFTAFFAPVQGPAAPAEGAALAAATVAAATAAVALDTGTDYVPRTGMALIHQGEAIIPASENIAPFSGGGGHSFNINLSAVDVPSFNSWLRNGGGDRMLAKMISDIMRKNPTLRPSY